MEVIVLTRLVGSLVREFGRAELVDAKNRARAAPENFKRMSINITMCHWMLAGSKKIIIGNNCNGTILALH